MNTYKLFLIAILFFLFACKKEKNLETKPIYKPIEEFVYASGEIKWENQYDIIAETDGILTELNVSDASIVEANQTIGFIDNKTNVNNKISNSQQLEIARENVSENSPQLKQLEENIKIAQIKYNQDKSNSDRFERLFEKESVAKIELENSLLTTKNSFSQLSVLKNQYNQIKSQARLQQIITKNSLQNSTLLEKNNKIIAFQKGKILNLFKEKGDYVKRGEVIAHVGEEEDIKAEINVDDSNIYKIKIDQLVYIKLNTNKNKVYTGRISKILPNFNVQNQTYTCEITFNDLLDFKINRTQLEANVLVSSKKKALLIPTEYLIYGDKVLLKSSKDTLKIKTGIKSTEYTEILSGLTEENMILKPAL